MTLGFARACARSLTKDTTLSSRGAVLRAAAHLALVVALAVTLLATSSCGDRRNLTVDEAEIVAWYVEDVSHGIPRRPEELRLVEGSQRIGRIAEWMMGNDIRGVREPPALLQARRNRLRLLGDMMKQGLIVSAPDSGLLAPRPGMELVEREVVEPVVDSENRDRRALDGIILSMADAPGGISERYLAVVRRARLELDALSGASIWKPSPSRK